MPGPGRIQPAGVRRAIVDRLRLEQALPTDSTYELLCPLPTLEVPPEGELVRNPASGTVVVDAGANPKLELPLVAHLLPDALHEVNYPGLARLVNHILRHDVPNNQSLLCSNCTLLRRTNKRTNSN